MLILRYESKKALKDCIGKPLRYTETSAFGEEYTANGSFSGSNRPSLTGIKRADGKRATEFFARVTMKDGLIAKVE